MSDWGGAAPRFEVLGPLRAWLGDTALNLGPVQQRVVLAVLLLHANRPIGREQIIDAVWGAAAPAYAVNLLQKRVSGLRRALEPDRSGGRPSRMLTWTDGGYLLNVSRDALDLEIFHREAGRGRAARSASDLSLAAETLHAALRLWRGPFCEGLTSPLLDAVRGRLAERRVDVEEERIEVDLALGNHLDLVADLRRLVADHPLREGLHGLLMLALYRSGRQADALSTFRDARRHLRDELGVEPGEQLRELHQRILVADPTLTLPTATDTTPQPAAAEVDHRLSTPAQLPHSIADFAGREAELDRLHALVGGDRGDTGAAALITAISGTAGVGKTALAVHWAHQIRDRYPDGQLYVNLRGFDPTGSAMELGEAIRGFLDAFAVPEQRIPVSTEAQGALYRSLLADRRVLIVLDNARDVAQVRPLLPGSLMCLVVVTSRNRLTGLITAEGAQSITVNLLDTAQARQLLAARIGPTRVATEPDVVDEMVALCAGLPLALAIVSARAITHPRFSLAVLAAELRQSRGGLDAFDGEDQATDVRAVFSWSYRALTPEAARLFRMLAMHAGSAIGAPAAASLAGIPLGQVRRLLAVLNRAHLLTELVPGRFAFHDLLRAYATEQAHTHDSDSDRGAALRRVLDHYLHTAHAADLLLNPHRWDSTTLSPAPPGITLATLTDPDQAMVWFSTEHHVLLAAIEEATTHGFDGHTSQLAATLTTFFDRRGHWQDSVVTQRAAFDAACRASDRGMQAHAQRGIARAYLQLGRDADACANLLQALHLYDELNDHTGAARTHLNLARMFDLQGGPREALCHSQRALDMFRTADDPVGQADALNAVGWYHAQLGSREKAVTYCQEALALHREIGDRDGEAHTWHSLGYAHTHLGDRRRAVTCYQHAIDLWHGLGDRYSQAEALVHLGDIHRAGGDTDAARSAWQHALTILEAFGHPGSVELRAKLANLNAPAGSPRENTRWANDIGPRHPSTTPASPLDGPSPGGHGDGRIYRIDDYGPP